MRRLRATITVLALVAAGASVGPVTANAAAEPIGDCTATSGVILAVDFGHWGGPVLRACGTATGTGGQLLNEGGWQTQGDQHDGPDFICRIGYSGYQNGTMYPTPAQDPCVVTPPTDAYWSFWLAPVGQNTWTYSPRGAFGTQPLNGEVEAWVFGATNVSGADGQPGFAPDAVRPTNTAPVGAPPAPAPPPARDAPSASGAPPANTGGHEHDPAPAPVHDAAPSASTTSPSTGGTASGSATSTGGTTSDADTSTPPVGFENAQPRADSEPATGSPLPIIIGGAVVVLLAGAGGFSAWRRRRQQ